MDRRILRAPAAWADVVDCTIEQRVVLLDPLGQGVFFSRERAGASNTVLACRQIELMIVLVDPLEVIPGRSQVTPSRRRDFDRTTLRTPRRAPHLGQGGRRERQQAGRCRRQKRYACVPHVLNLLKIEHRFGAHSK
jgi:hypothetical protein